MRAVLPTLIERAQADCSRHATAVQQCSQALQQAQATLAQLDRFRDDYLGRSPVLCGQAVGGQRLADWQRFVSRLDDAIGLQRQELEIRQHQQAQALALLGQAHRRLMSFEALARRAAQQQQLRQDRRAQAETDEFASRARCAELFGETR
jgi:flagellar protein FliJ